MDVRASSPEGPGLDPAKVCTLPPDDFGDRLAWIRQEILPHAVESERLEDGLAVELAVDLAAVPELAEKLERLIRLERECCSGLVFERLAGAKPDRLRLEIHGIDPDASVFGSLPGPGAPPLSGVRLAKAAGAGVFVSVLVCCVLPIGVGLLLGAAVAAPLASLDAPGPIAGGALLGGIVAWWWLGRRAHGESAVSASSEPCGPGC